MIKKNWLKKMQLGLNNPMQINKTLTPLLNSLIE